MADEMKNIETTTPEIFKVRTARAQHLSDEELENAGGGKCWFFHSYQVMESSVRPEGVFRKARCRDCGDIIYKKDDEEISKAEFDQVRNDHKSFWMISK